MHKLLDNLKWQIESGIDEVISDSPLKFSKDNEKTKNSYSINLDKFNLSDLYEYLKNSIECELKNISKNLNKIQGNLNSKIMIITNIPSPEEDKKGKVLVVRAISNEGEYRWMNGTGFGSISEETFSMGHQ